MSQLAGKSAEERQRGLGDAGHPCRYQEQYCSRGCGRGRHRSAENPWAKGAVHSAYSKHCRTSQRDRARRRDKEWGMGLGLAAREVWSRLGCDELYRKLQCSWPNEKPFENVWPERVKKVSNLPQGSLSSHAIEQLTISELSRHGQPELENHLRLRAPMA